MAHLLLGPGLVFVEGGSFTMGRVEQDVMYEWDNVPRKQTVASFYMDETEVTNVDYIEYLLISYHQFLNHSIVL